MEMEALTGEYLVPFLRKRTGPHGRRASRCAYGSFEPAARRIGAMPDAWPGASFAYLPSYFGVDLRVTVASNNAAVVRDTVLRAYNELMAKVRAASCTPRGGDRHGGGRGRLPAATARGASPQPSHCTGGTARQAHHRHARLVGFGSSAGFVTYANAAKLEQLGVDGRR